ncbi:saccharopine dehydrogenase family protein [Aquibium microcysteis]|uniref:saccharopine dehydrogenase family protein n=1 Tax=Aquibium microcysteis TaxID=675281 RepID=UPI00165D019F|nr:saccharopine dehydrogenase NADP-binding domain-containing protein [Aquibium microcysteis]
MTEPGRAGRVAIFGAGRVGLCLADLLASDWDVTLADCTEEALAAAAAAGHAAVHADASRGDDIGRVLSATDLVVAAVPDRLVPRLAAAAAGAGLHYLDFSDPGDEVRDAADRAASDRAFLPGCGVSPGLVDSVALGLAARLDPGCDLDIRVGAIPASRTNRLGYGLIWNLDGLLSEYTRPCAAIVEGERVFLPPLSGREDFAFGEKPYEAFLTAGSIGGLAPLVAPRARNLVFRTIRHPGHLDYMLLLLDDLGLRSRRDLLATVLRNGLPAGGADMVLIEVRADGRRSGHPAQERFAMRLAPPTAAAPHGALAVASAAHAAALMDVLRDGGLAGQASRAPALVPHEAILASRFFADLRG